MKNKYLFAIVIFLSLTVGLFLGRFIYSPSNVFFKYNKNFRELNSLIKIVNENYSDDIDVFKYLKEDLIRIINNIDPYSTYFSEDEFKNYMTNITGSYSGIGIQYTKLTDTIRVLKVFENSPAKLNGIKPLDNILFFNNDTIVGISVDSLAKLFNKYEGKIKLGILHFNKKSIDTITIKKTVVDLPSVKYSILDDSTIYIKISSFNENTFDEFEKKLNTSLKHNNIKKIILDLRNNPGGLLSSAVKIANEFFPKGDTIIITETNLKNKNLYISTGKGKFIDTKLIILVNENTASAAELVTLAIQDNDRGLIIGNKTYGKGVFQQDYSIQNNIAHITTGKYFGPSGRCINFEDKDEHFFKTKNGRIVSDSKGIMPDIHCKYLEINNIFDKSLNNLVQYIFIHKSNFKNIKSLKDIDSIMRNIETPADIYIYDENEKTFRNFAEYSNLFIKKIIFPDSITTKDFILNDSCVIQALYILKNNDLKKIMFAKDTIGF